MNPAFADNRQACGHVVHVVDTLQSGGVSQYVLNLATAPELSHLGHSVVRLKKATGIIAGRFQAARVPVHFVPRELGAGRNLLPGRFLRTADGALRRSLPHRLCEVFQQLGATLVHSHIVTCAAAQAEAAVLGAELPWVWTFHGFKDAERTHDAEWQGVIRTAARGVFRVTAVSEAVARDIMARRFAQLSGVSVIHGGADLSAFPQRTMVRRDWLKNHGLPLDAILFGTLGALEPVKGHDVFLRAAALVARENARAAFVIAGEGSERAVLEKIVLESGLQGRAFLPGRTEAPAEFLSQLDVFVMPSRAEGLGLALIEALAIGLPCVASAVGGIPEILGERCGLLVPPELPAELAAAMKRLIPETERNGVAGFARQVALRFSTAECAEKHARLYKSMLKPQPAAAAHSPSCLA